MKKFISLRFATNGLLIIFSLVIIFHAVVLIGFIPIDMVWGGRLTSKSELMVFETISILLNSLMICVVLVHAGKIKISINTGVIKILLWIMILLFLLNTIGNLNAINNWEKFIFTPVTFILALFSLRLVKS